MMRYRRLGKTDASVSALALGGMVFGWKTPEAEAARIVDRAIDSGINLIDTSNTYGRGRSEEIVGRCLKQNGARGKIFVSTKFHYWQADDPPDGLGNLAKHIRDQCEASLRRLQLETIDFYLLHRPGSDDDLDATLDVLDRLVREGKVRWIGASTRNERQIRAGDAASMHSGRTAFACEQAPYNLLDRRVETSVFPVARELDLGIVAWSPLAEGILTGKYRRGEPLPPESRYAQVTKPGLYRERLTESVFDALDRLESLARAKGCSMAEVALAWCLKDSNVSSVLIGPSSSAQLDANLRALRVDLDAADCAKIDAAFSPGACLTPYFAG